MHPLKTTIACLLLAAAAHAQSPAITSWLQNNTVLGTYYINGNPTAVSNNILVNCQKVEYSAANVYVHTNGVPAYPTGPFLDGNPSIAQSQSAIFKFPLSPTQNTGTPTATTMGNIGVFINGVALFDSRDGVSWKNSTNALAGGPLGGQGDLVWNRDAIRAEKVGFDCSKGHPAQGNYHHHQNPSAFKFDINVVSTVCNPYDANGLYVLDSTKHSPLIGFAYDGYPVYGAYGYKNTNGTGGIVRMKSSYQLRNITTRTTDASGASVTPGPAVNTTYFLGYFIEDYEFISHTGQSDYLDTHNGRFCVTPEYPAGTYAYFCTVDANWNSAYPYAVGKTFYGNWTNRKVTSVTEATTVYNPTGIDETAFNQLSFTVFPNPASELLLIQAGNLVQYDLNIELMDITGKKIAQTTLAKGSSLAYFDVQTLHEGAYLVNISGGSYQTSKKLLIQRN
jgi:hypothetical protein